MRERAVSREGDEAFDAQTQRAVLCECPLFTGEMQDSCQGFCVPLAPSKALAAAVLQLASAHQHCLPDVEMQGCWRED